MGHDSAIHVDDNAQQSSQRHTPPPPPPPALLQSPTVSNQAQAHEHSNGSASHSAGDSHNDHDHHENDNNDNSAPDDGDDSSDSGFDSESLIGDDTDTLASSILNYRIENGRQYHAYRDGAYWGPNDDMAKEILDFAHHMYLLTLDRKLHLAPISNPQRILDAGTGTGIWAIDMAG